MTVTKSNIIFPLFPCPLTQLLLLLLLLRSVQLVSFFTVTFSLLCNTPSRYCIEYSDGSLHDVLTFELIVVLSAAAAIFGYLRASAIHQSETYEIIDDNVVETVEPVRITTDAATTVTDNLLQYDQQA